MALFFRNDNYKSCETLIFIFNYIWTFKHFFLPKDHNMAKIPIVKKQSPTLLVSNADIELWFAAILVNQKFTKRYEHIPTPSHSV